MLSSRRVFNIPSNLRSLFEKDSKYLNQSKQKKLFAFFENFLLNFMIYLLRKLLGM